MMNRKILILLYCGLLAFYGCKSVKQTESTPDIAASDLTDRVWQLTEANGQPVPEVVNGKIPHIFLNSADATISGNGGCNGMGGQFVVSKNNQIAFKGVFKTMMACPDMEVEDRLHKALQAADNYTLQAGILSLKKGTDETLARFKVASQASLLQGQLVVNYVAGSTTSFEALYPDRKPFILFQSVEKRATGNTSCNNFSATYTPDNSKLTFSPPISTRMACKGDGERLFFEALRKVTAFSVSSDGKTLNLIAGDIAVMRLAKQY